MSLPVPDGRPATHESVEQEHQWVERVRAGDYEAFRTLFQAYHRPLEDFGRRLTGSREAAEDIVQDVFVAIWERRVTWVVTSGVHRYLYGAVRNRAFNVTRRRTLQVQVEPMLLADTPEPQADPAELADIRATVARAIERLPERCRVVYRLRHYHELTYAEIAHVLGLSVKTVEMHVTSALRILRGRLQHLR